MNTRLALLTLIVGGLLLPRALPATEEIPTHQARRILEAAPAQARVAPRQARRVLIWNTPPHLMEKDPHKGYCIPYGTAALETLGRKTGAFEPVASGDLAVYLPENIRQFDAIVMNNSSGPWITPTDADLAREAFSNRGADRAAVEQLLRQSLLDYVREGGGLVALHYAIGANRHWPQFQELLGATFTGHPWNEEVGITVEEPSHPLVAAFQGRDFRLADEIYQYGPPYDRAKVRVLLSLDPERSNMGVKWIGRDDHDFALAWVKAEGQGRVFYTSFGHRTELFWNPDLLRFYLDAIQFATGDLEAPKVPRADRPSKSAPGPTSPEIRSAKMRERQVSEPAARQLDQIRAAAPAQAPAQPSKARRVLVWGHSWTHQPNPYAEKALEILGQKSGSFQTVVSDDPRLLLGDRLPRFDALVLNNIHEPYPFRPDNFNQLGSEQQAAARQFEAAVQESILEFVRQGKGVVGIHAATAAFRDWPAYGELMGAFYGGHIHQEVAIKPDDPGHPINACFQGKPWTISDEIYIPSQPYSREKLRVLLSLDLDRMPDPGKRPDRDYAVSWVKPYGEGRVFYTTLGHAVETYWHPLFLAHLLAGIQFAIGDLPGEAAPAPRAQRATGTGFVNLFNGQDLAGWEGDRRIWSVRDGAITGQTTDEVRVSENDFLVWQGGQPRDFELRLQFKLTGGNSGIYFHAEKRRPGRTGEPLVGPQADFSADHRWTGVLMEYTKREVLAERGQRVRIDADGRKAIVGSTGDPGELLKAVKEGGWNEYHLIVRGDSVVLKINGATMCEVTDNDPRRTPAGHLALQVHTGPPMTVQFREIQMKRL